MPAPFIVAVALGAALLLAMNLIVRRRRPTLLEVLLLLVLAGTCIVGIECRPLTVQTVALFLALPLVSIPRRGRTVYHLASFVLVVAIWSAAALRSYRHVRRYDEWQRQNPFESLEDRLPWPTQSGSAEGRFWARIDEDVALGQDRRQWSLRIVHADRVNVFHRMADFGARRVVRMKVDPNHFEPDSASPVPQPERYDPNAASLGEEVPDAAPKPFPTLHANSLLDFTYPDGFGYVKSCQQVAGFRPHRFSKVPEPVEKWEVRRLELIGLLLHPTPKVYVSDNLPRMEEVKRLPTREPDGFEADGLGAIILGGKDLYSRGDDRAARMVGAIRSVNQCVECHGGQRGDLLGAFSYHLRRDAR